MTDTMANIENFKSARVIVTRILGTGTSFGMTTDKEHVFIRSTIHRCVGFQEGDVLQARLVPNEAHELDPTKAEWRAIRVEVLESFNPSNPPNSSSEDSEDEDPEDEDDLEVHPDEWTKAELREEMLDTMKELGGYWSTVSMTREIFGDDFSNAQRARVYTMFQSLFKSGDVVNLVFYTTPDAQRASREFFTTDERPWMKFCEHPED